MNLGQDYLGSILNIRSARTIRTRHVDLRTRGTNFGVRIVLASDMHARNDWFPRAHVAKLVDHINAIEGTDFVALVGDFVGDDPYAIDWSAPEYGRITAPTYGVLGNHDHWTNPDHIAQTLTDCGVMMLTNTATQIDDFWLAGLDSCWIFAPSDRGPDTQAAFAQIPEGAPTIVLGHEPHLATLHEHQLHLAGHTHCGQVRLPIFGNASTKLHLPKYSTPYAHRLYTEKTSTGDSRFIYTTAGVGYSTVAFRLFCPPEIVVIDA